MRMWITSSPSTTLLSFASMNELQVIPLVYTCLEDITRIAKTVFLLVSRKSKNKNE